MGRVVSVMVGLSWLTSEEPLLRVLPEVTWAWRDRGKATAESVSKVLIRFLRLHKANSNSKGPVARSKEPRHGGHPELILEWYLDENKRQDPEQLLHVALGICG